MKKFSGISAVVALVAAATLAGCPPPVDTLQTEQFAAGDAATTLSGKQLYFMPFGASYSRTVSEQTTLPVATTGHQPVDFGTADPFVLNLAAGSEVVYFGNAYSTLYIGSDGTVAFGAAGTGNDSLANHFGANQISLLPVDAADAAETGQVSYNVATDEVTITFEGVDGSTFQSEFFISGDMDEDIAVSYPTVDADVAAGVVGLSAGQLAGATQEEIDAFVADFTDSDLGTTNTG